MLLYFPQTIRLLTVNTANIKTFKTYSYIAANLKLTNGSVWGGFLWWFFSCVFSWQEGREGLCWGFFKGKYFRFLNVVIYSPG